MALWIEINQEIFIITGCCNSGLMNTINFIKEISRKESVALIL